MINQIGIYDHDTGENIVRDMTKQEQAERDAEIAAFEKAQSETEIEIQTKVAAKTALLKRLGITEEEARLLLA